MATQSLTFTPIICLVISKNAKYHNTMLLLAEANKGRMVESKVENSVIYADTSC